MVERELSKRVGTTPTHTHTHPPLPAHRMGEKERQWQAEAAVLRENQRESLAKVRPRETNEGPE